MMMIKMIMMTKKMMMMMVGDDDRNLFLLSAGARLQCEERDEMSRLTVHLR